MNALTQETAPEVAPRMVTIDVTEDGVAIVTLNDPSAPLNTITPEFGYQLGEAVLRIESDGTVRAAVLVSGQRRRGGAAGAQLVGAGPPHVELPAHGHRLLHLPLLQPESPTAGAGPHSVPFAPPPTQCSQALPSI